MSNVERLLKVVNLVLEGKGAVVLSSIKEDDKLRDDLGLDSFDLAELTVRIEEEFDVDIFSDGIITTVSEILDKIDE